MVDAHRDRAVGPAALELHLHQLGRLVDHARHHQAVVARLAAGGSQARGGADGLIDRGAEAVAAAGLRQLPGPRDSTRIAGGGARQRQRRENQQRQR
jgi:hypothetical protein